MNFDQIAADLFHGQINDTQHNGLVAIMDACDAHSMDAAYKAYVLATAYHETGGVISPNRENLNYSANALIASFSRARISYETAQRLGRGPGDPPLSGGRQQQIANVIYGGIWGQENLGNTQPNDGWWFRGGGMDHCTGRRNYRAVADAIGQGDALMTNPDLILQTPLAAAAIASGMLSGRYTGKKLTDYLPASGQANATQFSNARAIINGNDKADLIASYAVKFQSALS